MHKARLRNVSSITDRSHVVMHPHYLKRLKWVGDIFNKVGRRKKGQTEVAEREHIWRTYKGAEEHRNVYLRRLDRCL